MKRTARINERAAVAQGKEFMRYLDLWMDTQGPDEAARWLAGHVGRLEHRVGVLEKRLRALERRINP